MPPLSLSRSDALSVPCYPSRILPLPLQCSAPGGWDAADLAAATELGDATKCYYAIFDGAACVSNGGVYLIDTGWYSTHFGGNYGEKAAPKGCGTVVENWFQRSGSHTSCVIHSSCATVSISLSLARALSLSHTHTHTHTHTHICQWYQRRANCRNK